MEPIRCGNRQHGLRHVFLPGVQLKPGQEVDTDGAQQIIVQYTAVLFGPRQLAPKNDPVIELIEFGRRLHTMSSNKRVRKILERFAGLLVSCEVRKALAVRLIRKKVRPI